MNECIDHMKGYVQVIPVWTELSKHHFVPEDKFPPKTVEANGSVFKTSALLIDVPVDLLGVSATESLLTTGVIDHTDYLDSLIQLHSLVLEVGESCIEVMVEKSPTAIAHMQRCKNYRTFDIDYATDSICLVTDTGAKVYLELRVYGSVNLETSTCCLSAGPVKVGSIVDARSKPVDLQFIETQPLIKQFNPAKVIGYTLLAGRINPNRKEVTA